MSQYLQFVIALGDLPQHAADGELERIDVFFASITSSFTVEFSFIAEILNATGLDDTHVKEDMTIMRTRWNEEGALFFFPVPIGSCHVFLSSIRHDFITLLRSRMAFVRAGDSHAVS